jgi:hypothetical protein
MESRLETTARLAAMIIAASFDEGERRPPRPCVLSDGRTVTEHELVQKLAHAPKPIRVAARGRAGAIQVALDGSSGIGISIAPPTVQPAE